MTDAPPMRRSDDRIGFLFRAVPLASDHLAAVQRGVVFFVALGTLVMVAVLF